MTTELVWSTVKPTFEEVKGKTIRMLNCIYPDFTTDVSQWKILDKTDYEVMFSKYFICYADLTAPVSPLPLWGKLPELVRTIFDKWYMKYWSDNDRSKAWTLSTPILNTPAEAILAWNRIAEALEGVER